jgi:hypothetical protein
MFFPSPEFFVLSATSVFADDVFFLPEFAESLKIAIG